MRGDKACAYCNGYGNLTHEHVVPDAYHRIFGEAISIVKTSTEDKAIPNPQEVRDVCKNCNNVALSPLDDYLATLTKKYFQTIVHAGDRIRFVYDFSLLSRGLLKIAYNVARTRNWPLDVFLAAREFILGKAPCPAGMKVFLQLLIPTPVRKCHLPVTPGTVEIPPFLWHADLYDVGLPVIAFACSIWLRSYRFFILQEGICSQKTIRNQSLVEWRRQNKGVFELTSKGRATLFSSSVTVLDALKDNPTFGMQLAKARKLKAEMDLKSQ